MKVKGVNSVIRGLATFKEKGKQVTANVIQAVGYEIEAEAKNNAPVDMGKIKQSIVKKRELDGLRAKIEVGAPHGPFLEFGTGMYVDVPEELKTEALKFKGYKSGSFSEFLQDIAAWCKRKGIDEKAAYPIAISILRKGIKPQPFLYPAVVKYRGTVKPKLTIALDRLIKQTNAQK